MGYYVQTPSNKGRADFIVANMGGELVDPITDFNQIPAGKALIVVVDNGPFEAAGLVYSPAELRAFTDRNDIRSKKFVLMPKEAAYKAAGYTD